MTHDGCGQASKQVVVPDFWWLVARGAANDSESRFVFLLQFWHLWQLPVSAEGGFHFESDVSPLLFNTVAAQVEHDAQIGNTRV